MFYGLNKFVKDLLQKDYLQSVTNCSYTGDCFTISDYYCFLIAYGLKLTKEYKSCH